MLIPAQKTGHHCYTMELDPLYPNVIVQRRQKLTGRRAEKPA
jgi:DNA modification methylase